MKAISVKNCSPCFQYTLVFNCFTLHIFPISKSLAISFSISWLWMVHILKQFALRIVLCKIFLKTDLPQAHNSYKHATETKFNTPSLQPLVSLTC